MAQPPATTQALCGAFVLAALVALPATITAQDGGVADAAAPASQASALEQDPRTARVQALIDGTLDPAVAPQSLFEVPLDDEVALQVEAARVRALLRAVELATQPVAAKQARSKRGQHAVPDEGELRTTLAAVDPELWAQRLELDRARLEFYSLSAERRAELVAAHVARQAAAQPQETEEERRAREAEEERQRALEAAKAARTEAERLVSEELARLIALEARVRTVREGFGQAREDLARGRDAVLGWQRRVRDAKASGAREADATYDALRRALRSSRQLLAEALDTLSSEHTDVPVLGADPLVDVPAEISTDAARERRAAVQRAITDAHAEELALRDERAAALLAEIDTLNRERLALLAHLSPAKRDAITGFTTAGWDQARSEVRHLALILRVHRHLVIDWLRSVHNGQGTGIAPWETVAFAVPLLLVVVAFVWMRRRSPAFLEWEETRLEDADRAARRTTPSLGLRAVRVLKKVHVPLEWVLFYVCLLALLPSRMQGLLEVQLLASIAGWILSGALVVNTINALAAGGAALMPFEEPRSDTLRLRSLRLVGRTVIVFALILVLSERLVGEGTIYSWVFSTCWFSAVPVFLVLVRWWRGTVFERLDRVRKKTPLQAWMLENRSGWKSFAAAMIGAVQLFVSGAVKLVRRWVSGFDLARRAHAYLFRRELERIGEEHPRQNLKPLPAEALAALHPERAFANWLPCPADELRDALVERSRAGRGGVILVVGARGMGRSSLLRSVAERVGGSVLCSASEVTGADLGSASVVLVDKAHTLVEPRIGGFTRFDELFAYARARSEKTTWVFSINASVWPLLRRARDARPLFDETHVLEPWNETQLGALIADRNLAAGISPRYDGLLERLPPGADEIDRQDALRAKQIGYERMLWDHVGGNPGLAMEAWRSSLGCDEAGVVHVRPLQVPDITKLEQLPDASLFVLRAVLQLAPATVDIVAQATRLRPEEVSQDFRFGRSQGYYEEQGDQVRIAWPWLRAVSRLLERRHLLVIP